MKRLITFASVALFALVVGCSGDSKTEDPKPEDPKPAAPPADPAKLADDEPVTDENVDQVVDALEKKLEKELTEMN
jgi:hypothetical protein